MGEGAGMPPRRSARLHTQIQPIQQGAGVARRLSPRLRPQIQSSEEGAGVNRRRSPRLRPQVHSSEEGAGMARNIRRRRRCTSPAAADAFLPDDDDMLREILLCLPPQPSSLPRASAVCKRWRVLVTDPKFHRQFYAHHRKPPLLGIFDIQDDRVVFTSILDPPDRIPPERLSLGRYSSSVHIHVLLDCRHGRVLIHDRVQKKVVVFDPITGEQCHLAVPPDFKYPVLVGAVLCAADGCHTRAFKVVLLSIYRDDSRILASVYSSETGLWGNIISTEDPCGIYGAAISGGFDGAEISHNT